MYHIRHKVQCWAAILTIIALQASCYYSPYPVEYYDTLFQDVDSPQNAANPKMEINADEKYGADFTYYEKYYSNASSGKESKNWYYHDPANFHTAPQRSNADQNPIHHNPIHQSSSRQEASYYSAEDPEASPEGEVFYIPVRMPAQRSNPKDLI